MEEIRFHDKVEYRIPSFMSLPLTQAGIGTKKVNSMKWYISWWIPRISLFTFSIKLLWCFCRQEGQL